MKRNPVKLFVPEQEGQISLSYAKGGPREGAGRKKIGVTKKISLTLPEEIWVKLEKESANTGASRSEIMRDIVHFYYSTGDRKED